MRLVLHEDYSTGGQGIWKEETSWLRVRFLIGCGQGEVEVTGLAQLVCCLHAPVRRGLWLAVGIGVQELFQNRISRKKKEKLLVGHQEQRWGGGQGVR